MVAFAFAIAAARWYRVSHLCKMNDDFRKDTRVLALRVMEVLQHTAPLAGIYTIHGDNDDRYWWWVEFGSLLSLVRKEEIMPWDTDSDFAVATPSENISAVMAHLFATFKYLPGVVVSNTSAAYRSKLFQIYLKNEQGHNSRVHADIWVWALDEDKGELSRLNARETKVLTRRVSSVFPLQCDASWLGQEGLCVPAEPHLWMRDYYGGSYMTPVVNYDRCWFNFKDGVSPPEVYLVMGLVLLALMVTFLWPSVVDMYYCYAAADRGGGGALVEEGCR